MTSIGRIGFLSLILLVSSCVSTSISFPTKSLGTQYKDPKIVSGMFFKPEGAGPFPTVVLLHACGGIGPHITRDWASYLTDLGYAAFAVDTLGSRGVSNCANLTGGRVLQAEDAMDAFEHLATLPSVDITRVGVMGFSMGAMTINEYLVGLTIGKPKGTIFKAAVGLYGWCNGIDNSGAFSIPVLEIAAELDKKHASYCISVGKSHTNMEVHVLPGAYHAFDLNLPGIRYDPFGSKMLYSSSATEKARQLTKEFLAKHL